MTASRIDITTADGTAPAFVFGQPSAPGVLMFMDGIGMRPAMHQIAARLATRYHVLLPDLFWRLGAYEAPDPKALFEDPEVLKAWFTKITTTAKPAAIVEDTRAYLDHFGSKQVGLVGYCMGGRLAITAAETYPDRIAAAAAYHPGDLVTAAPDSPHLAVDKIQARIYIGGAMEDRTFTDEQRAQLEAALAAAGVDHVVERYQALHGFVPADTPRHDAAAAERHWDTLFALFEKSLA